MNRRLAIVTGGASGIGLSTTRQLIDEGWRVLVLDRDEQALATAADQIGDRAWLELRRLDVTNQRAVDDLVLAIDPGIPLKGLVNSAGIGESTPFLETDLERFRTILAVNLLGTFALCQAVSRRMQQDGGGAIVNLSSGSGLKANAGRAAYGASKAGVEMMSKVMAVELATSGIRVNTVAPGPIETPLVKSMHSPADRARAVRSVPQGRYGSPEDVARAVAFLLDDERSGYITGHTLCVDGGFHAAGAFGAA